MELFMFIALRFLKMANIVMEKIYTLHKVSR